MAESVLITVEKDGKKVVWRISRSVYQKMLKVLQEEANKVPTAFGAKKTNG